MNENFKGTYIEYHIIQSFPVTCLNRDDAGSPKTAIVGGTTRARVSSQCWKRAVRMKMQELGIKLGIRTKMVALKIKEQCLKLGANENDADNASDQIANALSKDTLLFFSEKEAAAFAEYAKDNNYNFGESNDNGKKGKSGDKKFVSDIVKIAKKITNKGLDALDISLFGRMAANAPELDVEAAASFAHAISTHKVSNEVDFFSALDDIKEANIDIQGAGHIGTLEYNSATYYRYISLNLGVLAENMGSGEDMEKAVESFTKALYLAVPSARQTSQSGASFWDYGKILIRKGQRMQVPFDRAILPYINGKYTGYSEPSIAAMNEYILKKEKEAGTLYNKINEYTIGDGSLNIDELIDSLDYEISRIKNK